MQATVSGGLLCTTSIVRKDMELIGDLYSEDLINKQTKNEFKGFVKKKVNETALKYLKDLQLGHSKTIDIKC